MEKFRMADGKEKLRFPFKGIHSEKFYMEGDPKFGAKVEEISLHWKKELEMGNKDAVFTLLREGGPSFLKVPWIQQQIRSWENKRDGESEKMFRGIQSLVAENRQSVAAAPPFNEKTLMLKDYDTYLERYTVLHEKRRTVCGDCPRYLKNAFAVSCFKACDFPDRFELLKQEAEDIRRLTMLFRYPPQLMALRLAVIDGEIVKRQQGAK
jgi:hypothetical protein